MKLRLIILFLLTIAAAGADAQFSFAGKIEYERKKNVHALFKDEEWFDRYKSSQQKFITNYFDLVFDTGRSCYKPGREVDNPTNWMSSAPANDNIVYTDFATKKVDAQKNVYEEKFHVQDSMRKLEWKEKDEIRTILGHQCRKAVSIICDTVYVVAFYAEDIPVSSGPEMFGGLPGMILELAVPRLHTTWTATKIEQIVPAETDYKIPDKGKKTNQKDLLQTLITSFSDWGSSGKRNVLWAAL